MTTNTNATAHGDESVSSFDAEALERDVTLNLADLAEDIGAEAALGILRRAMVIPAGQQGLVRWNDATEFDVTIEGAEHVRIAAERVDLLRRVGLSSMSIWGWPRALMKPESRVTLADVAEGPIDIAVDAFSEEEYALDRVRERALRGDRAICERPASDRSVGVDPAAPGVEWVAVARIVGDLPRERGGLAYRQATIGWLCVENLCAN